MSFLRAQRPLYSGSCEPRGTRARVAVRAGRQGGAMSLSGLGATDPVAAAESIAANASLNLANALSQSPAIKKQVMLLQAQLNRYSNAAPVGFQYVPEAPLPVDGVLSVMDAAHAVAILQWRYQNALAAYPGETASALSKLSQVVSTGAVLDPVGWVLGDLDSVTALLQKYGDANGLKPAAPITSFSLSDLASPAGMAVVIGGVALAFYLGSK